MEIIVLFKPCCLVYMGNHLSVVSLNCHPPEVDFDLIVETKKLVPKCSLR